MNLQPTYTNLEYTYGNLKYRCTIINSEGNDPLDPLNRPLSLIRIDSVEHVPTNAPGRAENPSKIDKPLPPVTLPIPSEITFTNHQEAEIINFAKQIQESTDDAQLATIKHINIGPVTSYNADAVQNLLQALALKTDAFHNLKLRIEHLYTEVSLLIPTISSLTSFSILRVDIGGTLKICNQPNLEKIRTGHTHKYANIQIISENSDEKLFPKLTTANIDLQHKHKDLLALHQIASENRPKPADPIMQYILKIAEGEIDPKLLAQYQKTPPDLEDIALDKDHPLHPFWEVSKRTGSLKIIQFLF